MAAETTVWSGHSSLLRYPAAVAWIAVCTLTVVLIPVALILYAITRAKANAFSYELTTQRLRLTTGILTKRTTEIELFRVKETILEEPLLMRLRGQGNIIVRSSDPAIPELILTAIPKAKAVREQLRTLELSYRVDRGAVREVESV